MSSRPTGKVSDVAIKGCVFPIEAGNLVLMSDMPSGGRLLLPVFQSEASARKFLGAVGFSFDEFNQIEDPEEFLNSLPRKIGIAVDPHRTDDELTVWTEVLRGS